MKKTSIIIIITLFSLLTSCIVCNHMSWYGQNNLTYDLFKADFATYVSLERHTKDIYIPPFIIERNVKDYQLSVFFRTQEDRHLKIDSVKIDLFYEENKPIIKNVIKGEDMPSIGGYNQLELNSFYLLKDLKKDTLSINLVVYITSKDNVSKEIEINNYRLPYQPCRGIHLFPF